MGRIFNYGTLVVNGSGGNKLPVKNISSPMVFRKISNEVLNAS